MPSAPIMHQLEKLLRATLSSGLKRQAVTKCSEWATKYRVMGKPFPGLMSFRHHPWAREMHDCQSELMVGQKGAQLGFTEVALNKTFFAIDILRESVLYILPASTPDASDFSTSRFDPALELSPHLRSLFSDVQNIGHKRAGSANLFIRGSRSRSQLKSLPVSRLIADEVDEMNLQNLNLAFERMSGQLTKQAFLLSTPTVTDVGINAYYKLSTQDHFFFPCPHCSKQIELRFPESLIITAESIHDPQIYNSYIICPKCRHPLDHNLKPDFLALGQWVPQFEGRASRGFHIPQLYSYTVRPHELAINFLRSQSDPTEEQEFYNSKLGEPHEVDGARVTDADIDASIGNHRIINPKSDLAPKPTHIRTIGIDVGKWLHYEIDEWHFDPSARTADINLLASCRVLRMGKVQDFEELDALMEFFNIFYAIIDRQPETRKALEFCARWNGRAATCHYDDNIKAKQLTYSEGERQINADRTSWLDLSLGRFHSCCAATAANNIGNNSSKRRIVLPIDTPQEYKDHIKSQIRVYEKDKNGNPVGRYVKPEHLPDHYAHARNYSELALPMAASLLRSEPIANVW